MRHRHPPQPGGRRAARPRRPCPRPVCSTLHDTTVRAGIPPLCTASVNYMWALIRIKTNTTRSVMLYTWIPCRHLSRFASSTSRDRGIPPTPRPTTLPKRSMPRSRPGGWTTARCASRGSPSRCMSTSRSANRSATTAPATASARGTTPVPRPIFIRSSRKSPSTPPIFTRMCAFRNCTWVAAPPPSSATTSWPSCCARWTTPSACRSTPNARSRWTRAPSTTPG